MRREAKALQEPELDVASGKAIAGTALLRKLFMVLDIVGQAPHSVSVPDLLARTSWPRATLYRILAAATTHGFLRQDPLNSNYTLGFRFIALAQNVWSSGDLVTLASMELRRLRDITGETAHLAVLQDTHMLALGKFESPHPHKRAANLGKRKPLHCTSQGKAALAFLPDKEADALIDRLELYPSTDRSITDPQVLRSQLHIIRQRGYAIDDEELVIGTRCVGAPILDANGGLIAVISIGGPTYRITSERVERLGPEIVQVANDIARLLRDPVRSTERDPGSPLAHPGHSIPALHGVSPSWDSKRQVLYWADRIAPRLHASAASTVAHDFAAEAPIDAVGHTATHAVAFAKGAVLSVDHDGGTREQRFEGLRQLTCLAARPDGIPFAASYADNEGQTTVGIMTRAGTIEGKCMLGARVEDMAWSPDGATLYASVPQRGLIYALTRNASNPRILARISKASGEPNGLAVDAESRLWVALYDGWSLARLNPDGEIDHVVALPVPRPTGLTFSNTENGTLYVTTARMNLSREVLENAPLSGRLLTVDTAVRGAPPPPMAYSPSVATAAG